MSHFLDRNKLVVNGTLAIDQNGRQRTDYILISGTFGEASWLKKQDYIPDKNFDHYIGELFGGGVVVSVWLENGVETCLVAGLTDIYYLNLTDGFPGYYVYNHAWTYTGTVATTTNASYTSFGASNSQLIVAAPGHVGTGLDRGGAQWALDLVNQDVGLGVFNDWYMPSINELMVMNDNLGIVNSVLYDFAKEIGILLTEEFIDLSAYPVLVQPIRTGRFSIYSAYWSSTEFSNTAAFALSYPANTTDKTGIPSIYNKASNLRVRPFRIATDNQKSFVFDADWMVLTYKFERGGDPPTGAGASDLDTWTNFSTPNLIGKVGFYAGSVAGWDPQTGYTTFEVKYSAQFNANYDLVLQNDLATPVAPGVLNNTLMYLGGDNTGVGYETVLINVARFKQLYPNQTSFTIDAKCGWYVNTWNPSLATRQSLYPGLTAPLVPGSGVSNTSAQYWLNLTPPVVVSVEMFKGGKPYLKSNYTWSVANATDSLEVESYTKKVSTTGSGNVVLSAQIKYDINKKICTLIKT